MNTMRIIVLLICTAVLLATSGCIIRDDDDRGDRGHWDHGEHYGDYHDHDDYHH